MNLALSSNPTCLGSWLNLDFSRPMIQVVSICLGVDSGTDSSRTDSSRTSV